MRGVVFLAGLATVTALGGCGARTLDASFDEEFPGADTGASDVATGSDDGVIVPGADATPVVDSGVVVADAGPPGRPIACGRSTCDSARQQCCFPGDGSSFDAPRCTPIGGCDGIPLSCSSAVSCGPGLSCCLSERDEAATCKPACNTGSGREITLCTSNAECPMGQRCRGIGGGLRGCERG